MPRIDEMYAFICEEAPGDEGVIAESIDGQWYPLVGADEARIKSLRSRAIELAKLISKPVRLVRFSTRTDIELL